MYKKYLFFILLINFVALQSIFAENRLTIQDPKSTWRFGAGTIEKAVLSIKPHGLFMEYGLYLTFSAQGLGFSGADTVEVQFFFELPENSMVHDSWLWIGDDIIRGKIMDKWTAASIYENIVKRRKDPSILYKRSEKQYELRIFPMAGNGTRKVKITYFTPTQWTKKNVMAELPVNLLKTSRVKLSAFHLLAQPDATWKHPQIIELPELQFENHPDTEYRNYVRTEIGATALTGQLNFALDAPLTNGFFLNRFEAAGEGFYELAILPDLAFKFDRSHKVAFLFDYDASNSDIDRHEILANVKTLLRNNFTPADSFNIIFSNLVVRRASEVWLPADTSTIENTFANLRAVPIANYSNLPSVLANGIDFIKTNGNQGRLLLISNSDQVGENMVANLLITDLLNLMDPKFPIHVADFQTKNYPTFQIGGQKYIGNEYFYVNLTRLTAANYSNIRSIPSLFNLLSTSFEAFGSSIYSADFHTKLENGVCYARYNFNEDNNSFNLYRPVRQVGRYKGSFPLVAELAGIYENSIFSQQVTIEAQEINQIDSLTKKIWAGCYIKSLEAQPQTNVVVSEIVEHSISERLLSNYTAFLCLEPARGGEVCYDCLDESALVGVENDIFIAATDSVLQAYPNPFNAQTTIQISLPVTKFSDKVTYKIFNMLGQVVRTFTPEKATANRLQLVWEGKNDSGFEVSSGNYFFVVSTPEKNYSLKLVLVK